MLLSEAWELFESERRLQGFSPHTLKAYGIQKNLLIRHIGDVPIQEVTTHILKHYLSKAAKHLKPSSVDHRIRYIKSFFRWAHDEGFIKINPAASIKRPKLPKRIPKTLTEEDIEFLRESCKTPLENALFEFMFATGCRIGEIHRLNRNTINWEDRSAIVRGKGDKEREVYFNIRCVIWLKKYLKQRTDTDVALFVTERRPIRRMSIAQIRWVIKRIAKRSGIEKNIYPHRLRHTFATHLLNNDAPIELIQSYLGHSKLETTRVYAELSGERRRELYRKYF